MPPKTAYGTSALRNTLATCCMAFSSVANLTEVTVSKCGFAAGADGRARTPLDALTGL
jgi:hypothetical protein